MNSKDFAIFKVVSGRAIWCQNNECKQLLYLPHYVLHSLGTWGNIYSYPTSYKASDTSVITSLWVSFWSLVDSYIIKETQRYFPCKKNSRVKNKQRNVWSGDLTHNFKICQALLIKLLQRGLEGACIAVIKDKVFLSTAQRKQVLQR